MLVRRVSSIPFPFPDILCLFGRTLPDLISFLLFPQHTPGENPLAERKGLCELTVLEGGTHSLATPLLSGLWGDSWVQGGQREREQKGDGVSTSTLRVCIQACKTSP